MLIFKQDNAQVHRACDTFNLLAFLFMDFKFNFTNKPIDKFIVKWLLNSPQHVATLPGDFSHRLFQTISSFMHRMACLIMKIYCKLIIESASEGILRISQHFIKLWSKL